MASQSNEWKVAEENAKQWFARFEGRIWLSVSKMDKETEKNALRQNELFGQIGREGFNLLSTLVDGEPSDHSYKELKDLLIKHGEPSKITIAERYEFSLTCQGNLQISDYVTLLYTKAKHCEFEAQLKTYLRDRFVFGLRDPDVRSMILNSPEAKDRSLTFDRAVELAKSSEAVNAAEKLIKPGSNSVLIAKHGKHSKTQDFSSPKHSAYKSKCGRCGRSHPPRQCPAFGQNCKKCGKRNHWASCCKNRSPKNDLQKSAVQSVNDFQFQCLNVHGQYPPPWIIPVSLDEKCKIKLTVDSGSPVTIVPFSCVSCLQEKIKSTNVKLRDFSQNDINLLGELQVMIGPNETLPVYVSKEGTPVMGRQWIKALNLMPEVCGVESTSKQEKRITAELKLKDERIKPIWIPARRIPYSLEKGVSDAIQKLVDQGILEPVEYSQWSSPIVTQLESPMGQSSLEIFLNLTSILKFRLLPSPRKNAFSKLLRVQSGFQNWTLKTLSSALIWLNLAET